jgi:hypothetical protein
MEPELARSKEWLIAVAVLCLAVLIGNLPVVIGTESYYHVDRFFLHVPLWHGAWETIVSGEFPFWTHGVRGGYPLFASGEASLAYPFTYLFAPFFPAHRALDFFTLFHLVLGGFFCWLYLRRLTGHGKLALICAVTFATSGRLAGMTIWGHAVAAAAYLPLLLWGIDRRSILVIALAVGLGALTGRPQVHLLSLLIGCAYAGSQLARTWWKARRFPARESTTIGVGFALGLCLSCVQLLPTLAFVSESSRPGGTPFAEWIGYSLGTEHLNQVLVPGSFPIGWPEASAYPTLFVYAGLCLGIFHMFRRHGATRRVETVFWLILGALSMYVAFGGPGAYSISQELPLIRGFRVPARFAYVASFGVIVIAAFGWLRTLEQRRKWFWLLLGITIVDGSIATFVGRHTVLASAYEQTQRYVSEIKNMAPDETGSVRRFHADLQWIPPTNLAEFDDEAVNRAFANLAPCFDLALRHGLRAAQGYGEPCFRWFPEGRRNCTNNTFRQLGVSLAFLNAPPLDPGWEEFPSGSPSWKAYRIPGALPRAKVYYETVRVPDAVAAYHGSSNPEFDVEKRVVVSDDLPSLPSGDASSVRLVSESANRISFAVETDQPGYLVMFDTWAPGWTVKVGGEHEPMMRANGLFRLVRVRAGSSTVEFEYVPPGFLTGLLLSLLAVIALILIGMRNYAATRTARIPQ